MLSGPNGDKVITDFAPLEQPDGTYRLIYNVCPSQMSNKVAVRFYDKADRPLIVLNGRQELMSFAKAEYSVRDYIGNASAYTDQPSLCSLVSAISLYGRAAENYFKNTDHQIRGTYYVDKRSLEQFKPGFGDDVKISLVLNSAASVRIYTGSSDVKIDGKTAVPKINKKGQYYELADIPAHRLSSLHTITIDGKEYEFSPLSYSYRAVNNPKASPALVDLANAIYIYAMAANAYSHE